MFRGGGGVREGPSLGDGVGILVFTDSSDGDRELGDGLVSCASED